MDAEAGLEWLSPPTLCLCILLLTAGLIGDVKGRKLVFTVGLALFTAASARCALAPSMTVLVIVRCVQGAAAAALFPSTLSIIRHTFSDSRERAQAIGVWAGVAGIAADEPPAPPELRTALRTIDQHVRGYIEHARMKNAA